MISVICIAFYGSGLTLIGHRFIFKHTIDETLMRTSIVCMTLTERKWLVKISKDTNWNLPLSSPSKGVLPEDERGFTAVMK